jgi:hypothetical protein
MLVFGGTIRWLTVLMVGGLLLVGCADEDGDVPPAETGEASPFSLAECRERFGYPCLRDDVDPAVKELQAEYVAHLSSLIRTESREAAFAWIQGQDRVVESHLSGTILMFRVDGGMPTGIVTPIEDTLLSSADAGDAEPSWLGATSSDQLVLARDGSLSAGERSALLGVVGEDTDRENPQNRKKALFLESWESEEGSLFGVGGRFDRALFKEIPDYNHQDGIVHITNAEADPTWFTRDRWRDFDFIYVSTHGATWEGGAILQSGVRSDWDGKKESYQAICDQLMGPHRDLPGVDCGEQQKGTKQWVTLDLNYVFFWVEYWLKPLERAIVVIEACESLKYPVLAAAIAGNSSAFLGWTDFINLKHAREGSGQLLVQLTKLRRNAKAALDGTCLNDQCGGPRFTAEGGDPPYLRLHENGDEPKKLRLYDPPVLRDPEAPTSVGPGLQDGAELRIIGTPGDGENDKLEIAVDVTGVIDPDDASAGDSIVMHVAGSNALRDLRLLTGTGERDVGASRVAAQPGDARDLYNLRFLIGDREEEIGADNLGRALNETATVDQLGDTTYRYTFTADLPFDVDPEGTDTKLKVEVDLPEGGISDYEVNVTLVGSLDPCKIITTEEVFSALGETLEYGPDGVEFPLPEGTRYCGWGTENAGMGILLFSGTDEDADILFNNWNEPYSEEVGGIGDRARWLKDFDGPWERLSVRVADYYVSVRIVKQEPDSVVKVNMEETILQMMRTILDRLPPPPDGTDADDPEAAGSTRSDAPSGNHRRMAGTVG